MNPFNRRAFLSGLGALAALPYLASCDKPPKGRVVIVGGGFGGATCARYIRLADPRIEVILIEKNPKFITCPFSNAVLGGLQDMDSITHSYDGLKAQGVNVMTGEVITVDGDKKTVYLADGGKVTYDRLVLSPGISIQWDAIAGYDEAAAQIMPHAWKAGEQTVLLKKQLTAMDDGGVVVISAPEYPYRCPPAPYERASLIAHYLKTHKPKSKILILDAKDKFTKQPLFLDGWNALYPGMIEWVPKAKGGAVTAVDPKSMTLFMGDVSVRADVVNVVPPQRAGKIALTAGAAKGDGDWCLVDSWTFESRAIANVHVIGDAIVPGDMPKSGFAANNQGKACAAALVSILNGGQVKEPVFLNTCYSLLAPDYGISINGAYRARENGLIAISGSGGTSAATAIPAIREKEAGYARGWYASITQEMFG